MLLFTCETIKLLSVEFIQLSLTLSYFFAMRLDQCDEQIDIISDSNVVIKHNDIPAILKQ
jgi:hypothetical protein